MTDIVFGIVAEGGGDCVVLTTLLTGYVNMLGTSDMSVKFKGVQPYVDNTSGAYSDGGWEQIYKWCVSNDPSIRESLYLGAPLFADDMDAQRYDALIIHMDADICDSIGGKTSITPVPDNESSAGERGHFIREVLSEWLWPEGPQNDSRHIIAPAVESTEAWLVAGLSDDVEPELNRDVQRRLAELDYLVVRKRVPQPGMRKPDKRPENFQRIANVAVANVALIAERCEHFRTLADEIDQFLLSDTANT